jgi:hypothetical protein
MCWVTEHGVLLAKGYYEAMMDKLDKVPKSRFKALCKIEMEKIRVVRTYNRRVWE